MGDKSTFVFGVSGGSIGRSAENDWVLPDDMRYVSGRHARIIFHKGRYLLQDTSSNGTYVNDNDRPLGSQNPHELKSGDILRIGEYHVQVQIDSSTDFSLDDSALYKRSSGSTSTRRRPPPGDLGASLRLENLLEASNDISSDELKPVNAFGQAVSSRTRALHQTQDVPKESSTAPELEVDSAAVARRIARLAKAAAKQQEAKQQSSPPTVPAPSPAPVSSPPAHDNTPGLQAFCRGAGIGPETLPVDAHARMLHLAGQLLRESLLGLKASNRSQQEQRNQLRVTWEKPRADMLPSLERHSVEELIQELLKAHDSRRFDAVNWLRESFASTRQHDDAMMRAMFAASSTSWAGWIRATSPRVSSAAHAARPWATGSCTASSIAACARHRRARCRTSSSRPSRRATTRWRAKTNRAPRTPATPPDRGQICLYPISNRVQINPSPVETPTLPFV
jgi:type VI secretion system FHA domain protein